MRNKPTIIVLLVVFSLICLYNLFFTYRQFSMSSKYNAAETNCIGSGKKDSLACADYESLVKDTAFQNRYKGAIDRSFTLGLDLQGGMLATLEIGVEDVIRHLAPNSVNDTAFNAALKNSIKIKENSQEGFVSIFIKELKKINPNAKLGAVFMNNDRGISVSTSDDDVRKMLDEEAKGAIDRTFNIIRTRIDQFGVVSPNLQKQEGTGRIIVELPGVKEPERVRKLLRSTAKLEFWTTYTIEEAIRVMVEINEKSKIIEGLVKEDTTKNAVAKSDSTNTKPDSAKKEVAKKDSAASNDLASGDSTDKDSASLSKDEQVAKFKRENPFFGVCPYPDLQSINPKSPLVGYAMPEDTIKVNQYLKNEEISEIIPDDMAFFWTLKPIAGKAHGLVAIRAEGGEPVLGGDKVTTARRTTDENNRFVVDMSMNIEGAQDWARITEDNIQKSVAITLDRMVYSFPTVQGKIAGGRSQITGDFTADEAGDLANVLKAGQLPVPAKIIGEDIVGPSLGASNINSGLISFVMSLLCVGLFMVWYYRKAGVYAVVALLFNLFALIAASAAFNIVLTLPGIAGIILTIGMAVDANVLVFERVRVEFRHGKTQKAAIKAGFQNAFSSIIDSNVTTLLTGVVLFAFGVGPIKGFAVTLIIGILTSLVSTLLLTRLILEYYADKGQIISFGSEKTLNMFDGIDLKFTKRKKSFYMLSGTLTVISIVLMLTVGFKLGVDFKGGRQYVVEFQNKSLSDADLERVRTDLTTAYAGEAPVIKTLASSSQVQVTTSYKKEDVKAGDEIMNKLLATLDGAFPGSKPKILSSSDVGPTVANDIKRSAFFSVIFSLIIIALYILIRFYKWQYSLGAFGSLFHDVIIILGIFSFFKLIPLPFNVEIDQTFIAAVLTLIGYSINDTVVVFDRVREKLMESKALSIDEVFDKAINETLSRTLITAGTTLMSALVLLILGGAVIKGFVFAIFMGILFGTYSSIFVASAIALDLFLKNKETSKTVAAAK